MSNWKGSSPISRTEGPRNKRSRTPGTNLREPYASHRSASSQARLFTRSISHLTGIVMSAEACLRWLARDPAEPGEARKSAMRVLEEGRRASDIVTGLRCLVRDAQLRFSAVQINDAVE